MSAFKRIGRSPRILLGAAGLSALLGFSAPVAALGDGFTDVSFTVSGSPNAWILDFTVLPINPANMEFKSYIANFQIGVEGGPVFDSPTGYVTTLVNGETAWQGNKNVVPSLKQSVPDGIGGFQTLVTTAAAPTAVSWTVELASGDFSTDFYVNGSYQATVVDSGVAHFDGVTPAVPEVGTLELMLLGLGVIGGSSFIRRRAFPRLEAKLQA